MAELIDRDTLIAAFERYDNFEAISTDSAFDIIIETPAVDAVTVVHGRWLYEIDRKPCYASYEVHAKCSECGWKWFSEDGVGNYSAVFGAFFTNYRDNPEQADAFLMENAMKRNKFVCCPNCGAHMDAEGGDEI